VAKFEEDGHRYLVREYIDGKILSQELIPGVTWSQTQVFDFLMDIIGILCFVHGFQYIHQDINPHNIIRRNDDDRFNLIGFSSAKELGRIDQHISINYPPNCNHSIYVPYEQEQNAAQFNSDIYAVGAIAIQALTGRFPIDRDPDSYEFQWREGLNIDEKLIKIIDRMVRPDYRNRYQSGLEVLADLQSFALTQLSVSNVHQFKPYLVVAGAISALIFGLIGSKILSELGEKSQPLAPIVTTIQPISTNIDRDVNWQTYIDEDAKIKLQYPNNWQHEDTRNIFTGENIIFTSPIKNSGTKYQENISIRVEKLTSPGTNLSTYTQAVITEIKESDRDAKIIESSSIILGQKPAKLVVYTSKDENLLPIKNLEAWTIDRDKVYIITYKAEPDQYYQFLETAMRMINSLELP
jgi:serine/threonine-protein kinase